MEAGEREWERQRGEQWAVNARDAVPMLQALAAAGVNPDEFGRFVSRVVPGIIEPSGFDQERAVPVLVEWLPRIANEHVKDSMVMYLRTKSARPAAGLLIAEFTTATDSSYRWAIAETLAYIAGKDCYPELTELAARREYGHGRQPLTDMLWRMKTPRADEIILSSLDDPDVARHAMSALRRRIGNGPARPHIEPLTRHQDRGVQRAATDYLRRIDRALARSG